jgi:hypothetical protein
MAASAKQSKPGYVREIVTGIGRLAFPHLVSPNSGGQFPSNKYEAHLLIPKTDTATLDLLRRKALEAAQQVWPKIPPAALVVGLRDGAEKGHLEGFSDAWFINAKAKRQPPVFDGQRQPYDPAAVKGGDYVRFMITAGAYKKNLDPETAKQLLAAGVKGIIQAKDDNGKVTYYRPAVTFYLDAVQFVRQGTPMGGGGAANPGAFPTEDGGGNFAGGASNDWAGAGEAAAAGDDDPPF